MIGDALYEIAISELFKINFTSLFDPFIKKFSKMDVNAFYS